ncbi:hypothetical protein FJY93_04750 [Candidatus Kaiserbacteria bacterium]|nr:hypothetical protein [Candidatus Kaiserbacteria bacterium]
MQLEKKTINGLRWIVGILKKHEIPYRIGGGLAVHVYGSERPINDIDISLSGVYFEKIVPEVRKYITAGPKHYSDEKWDCDTLSLEYEGQEIDITDIDTLRMSNREKTEWFYMKDRYRAFDIVSMNVEGETVSLIHPRDLVGYKQHLDGDHQSMDIEAIERYMGQHSLV